MGACKQQTFLTCAPGAWTPRIRGLERMSSWFIDAVFCQVLMWVWSSCLLLYGH